MVIKKILIANRGEIACRVIRTCAEMGIATVAVYSEADRDALHVEAADEAFLIGPAAARESYLNIPKILQAAKEAGADAVHPGYGFLSENEDFAEACEKAGVIFIGPPPAAIRAMGGKSEAKALMEKAGVPLVPGYHGDKQDEKILAAEAEKTGFPVLIKASAGGGGKGMRVVERAEDFADQLAGAKREAKAAFGDEKVLIEKYIANPRHVEIQVFADRHGNCVYLFERDCSIQRRHQKVLEEAPAPGLSEKTRGKMGAAAVAAAKAIGYVGAGTVEFLLDASENFYFMEMNTRLQVEHPVTEMITGLDLVGLQIRAAQGERLPFTQSDLKINGHAVEVRLYAEDPQNNFLPGAGQIRYLRFPMESDCVRVDTGVREAPYGAGDVISIHYDPMIAKIIAWGKDRVAAIGNLSQALDETLIAGPKTNLVFLRALLKNDAFRTGKVSTHFIKAHEQDLLRADPLPREAFALAALGLLAARDMPASQDPWNDPGNWRIGGSAMEIFRFEAGSREDSLAGAKSSLSETVDIQILRNGGEMRLKQDGREATVSCYPSGYDISFDAKLGGKSYNAVVLRDGRHLTLMYNGHHLDIAYLDPLSFEAGEEEADGRLHAPMPGKVVAVRVGPGAKVTKGQPLVIVEAMKMEHTIVAPGDGVIEAIHARVGDQVDEKFELIAIR